MASDSDFPARDFDMFEVSNKLNLLFHNADAVVQRAGFSKTPEERLSINPQCFVDCFDSYSEAENSLCDFVRDLDTSNMKAMTAARDLFFAFTKIKNDGSEIFNFPQKEQT